VARCLREPVRVALRVAADLLTLIHKSGPLADDAAAVESVLIGVLTII
jgi:hypothetical protein